MTLTTLEISHISIIVPTLNEEANLENLLNSLQENQGIEIIVADGGSTDKTVDIARRHNVKLVASLPGRALQQNEGAKSASGDILLFLHSDTGLPLNFQTEIDSVLAQPGTVAGAFLLRIDSPGAKYRFIEWGANLRSRFLGIPYGDQALFIRKSVFDRVGGFSDQPLLEDLELVRRLKRIGKVVIAGASVTTSARRWVKLGPIRTTLINQVILLGYFCGISPHKLARKYYGKPSTFKG